MKHFKLKDAFALYRKCPKCDFELMVSSNMVGADIQDWKYCTKCGHKFKMKGLADD